MWWHERGPHGYGVLNDARRKLLTFVSVNEATVYNTGLVSVTFISRHGDSPNSSNGIVLILLSLIGCICGDVETSELYMGQNLTLIINF